MRCPVIVTDLHDTLQIEVNESTQEPVWRCIVEEARRGYTVRHGVPDSHVAIVVELLAAGFTLNVCSYIGADSDERRVTARESIRERGRLVRERSNYRHQIPLEIVDTRAAKIDYCRSVNSWVIIDDQREVYELAKKACLLSYRVEKRGQGGFNSLGESHRDFWHVITDLISKRRTGFFSESPWVR